LRGREASVGRNLSKRSGFRSLVDTEVDCISTDHPADMTRRRYNDVGRPRARIARSDAVSVTTMERRADKDKWNSSDLGEGDDKGNPGGSLLTEKRREK